MENRENNIENKAVDSNQNGTSSKPDSLSESSSTKPQSFSSFLSLAAAASGSKDGVANQISSSTSFFFNNLPSSTSATSSISSSSTSTAVSSLLNDSAGGFVFGQNLQDRCTSSSNSDQTVQQSTKSPAVGDSVSTSATNDIQTPSSSMLFCDFLKHELSNATGDVSSSIANKRSLSESAIECEESRANKRKLEEVVTVTGEEDEINIFQSNCKIFAFDSVSKCWKERGNGSLRLNDRIDTSPQDVDSRIIVRSMGIQKVILNTKIWSEMTVEKANTKSIRLTAIDSTGDLKIFLVVMNPEKVKELYDLIVIRIENDKTKKDSIQNGVGIDNGNGNEQNNGSSSGSGDVIDGQSNDEQSKSTEEVQSKNISSTIVNSR